VKGADAVRAILLTADVLLKEDASMYVMPETSGSDFKLPVVLATWESSTNGMKQSILFIRIIK
jgi:hypothetical protein